jgi:hypothetical protein
MCLVIFGAKGVRRDSTLKSVAQAKTLLATRLPLKIGWQTDEENARYVH